MKMTTNCWICWSRLWTLNSILIYSLDRYVVHWDIRNRGVVKVTGTLDTVLLKLSSLFSTHTLQDQYEVGNTLPDHPNMYFTTPSNSAVESGKYNASSPSRFHMLNRNGAMMWLTEMCIETDASVYWHFTSIISLQLPFFLTHTILFAVPRAFHSPVLMPW